ncbi:hypothetical protein MDA_GLEAN10026227 [Myotis davidii]|uniref:Uncharacterized protein n=1 Tax=Myotis davidii TaxID=225400 RepID=L5M240_MYODS|nr:hypothetical protein MDA_GLEAN10026227 [Myotis davidii]
MIQTSYRNQSRCFATRSRRRGLNQHLPSCRSPGDPSPASATANNWTSIYLDSFFKCGNLLCTVHQAGPGLKVGSGLSLTFPICQWRRFAFRPARPFPSRGRPSPGAAA